jgi:hypothetical protein
MKRITQEQAVREGYTIDTSTMTAFKGPMHDPKEIAHLYTDTESDLIASLNRVLAMHDAMFKKTNVGASFYDAETLREMNEAPLEARRLLKELEGSD